MVENKKAVERRKRPRYQVADGAFVRIGENAQTLAQIIEVSTGGLSFLHVSGDKPLEGKSETTILLADHSYYFDKLPCEIVSDDPIPTVVNLGSRIMMRGSIVFGELMPEQKSQLEYFIRNYTTGKLEP